MARRMSSGDSTRPRQLADGLEVPPKGKKEVISLTKKELMIKKLAKPNTKGYN